MAAPDNAAPQLSVALMLEALQRYSHLSSAQAAAEIGLGLTAFKKLCRTMLGAAKWQDVRSQCHADEACAASLEGSQQLWDTQQLWGTLEAAMASQEPASPRGVLTPEQSRGATWWEAGPAADVVTTMARAGGAQVGPEVSRNPRAPSLLPFSSGQGYAAEATEQCAPAGAQSTLRQPSKRIALSFAPPAIVIKIAGSQAIQAAVKSPGTPSFGRSPQRPQQDLPQVQPDHGSSGPAALAVCVRQLAEAQRGSGSYNGSLQPAQPLQAVVGYPGPGALGAAHSSGDLGAALPGLPCAGPSPALGAGWKAPRAAVRAQLARGGEGSIAVAGALQHVQRLAQPQGPQDKCSRPTAARVGGGGLRELGVGVRGHSWELPRHQGAALPRRAQPFKGSAGSAFTPYMASS